MNAECRFQASAVVLHPRAEVLVGGVDVFDPFFDGGGVRVALVCAWCLHARMWYWSAGLLRGGDDENDAAYDRCDKHIVCNTKAHGRICKAYATISLTALCSSTTGFALCGGAGK